MHVIRVLIFLVSLSAALSPSAQAKEKKSSTTVPKEQAVQESTAEKTPESLKGTYDQGNAPFKAPMAVLIAQQGDNLAVTPQKKSVAPWLTPMARLRGATTTDKGVWVYWFDDADNTVSAYIKSTDKDKITSLINSMVSRYYESGDERRKKFEEYRAKALKESQ